MAVPAHDERDFKFAKKYNLSIKQVILPTHVNKERLFKLLDIVNQINKIAKQHNIKVRLMGGLAIAFVN